MKKIKFLLLITLLLVSINIYSNANVENIEDSIMTNQNLTYKEEEYVARTYIDSPSDMYILSVNETLEINGWCMSNDEQIQIKIYIDDVEQEIKSIVRQDRPDVLVAIEGYGGVEKNPQPGYSIQIDSSKIKSGIHSIKTEILSRNGKILARDTRIINVQGYSARTYIDSPEEFKENNITGDKLTIFGWVMTNDVNSKIEIYVDDRKQDIIEENRTQRKDVIDAIKGFGSEEQNPTPGYSLTIDLTNINDGNHTIKVDIISATGEILATNSRNINLKKYNTRLYVETPEMWTVTKPLITVSGWVMTTDTESKINIYIDGQKQSIKDMIRLERRDVINVIKGYGDENQNPTPGFLTTINASKLSEGIHNLVVEIQSQSGEILATSSKTITIEKYRARTYIDSPEEFKETYISGDKLTIFGWVMSDDKNIEFKVYINNKEMKIEDIIRTERRDVLNAIKGYGDESINPTPGYSLEIDIDDIKDGKYILRVDIVSETGEVIANDSRNIIIDKYNARAYIEIPEPLSQFKSNLMLAGWIMTTDNQSTLNVYINNKKQEVEIKRIERMDVINSIKGYGGIELNPTPGYETQMDISQLQDGKYDLKVELVSREGEILYSETRNIVIYNKYNVGIDVSKWNGNINWAQVKQAGIDFAIIRAGYRGYGTEGTLVEDVTFEYNMREAIKNGIEVGVYFYSQAINEAEAIQEAQMTIDLIRKYGFSNDITYPVIIDVEASSGRGDNISKEQRTSIIKVFCEKIKQEGYKPMLYSNKNWLEEYIDMSQLTEYDVWLAHYTGTEDPINNPSNYSGIYHIWQYTSSGSVIGINGNVDINIAYKKYFK